jgi:hypothetical protein
MNKLLHFAAEGYGKNNRLTWCCFVATEVRTSADHFVVLVAVFLIHQQFITEPVK